MKLTLTFAPLIFCLGSICFSQGLSKEENIVIEEYLKITKFETMLSNSIEESVKSLSDLAAEIGEKDPEIFMENMNIFLSHIKLDDILSLNKNSMLDTYTLQEIKGLTKFYRSKLGQKLLEKEPLRASKIYTSINEIIIKTFPTAKKEILENLKKRKKKSSE